MVLGRGLRTTMAGIVIGTLASLFVSRVLRSLLFGISSTDSLAFSVAALLLLVVAMFSSYLPARRAMSVDPATVLKSK
jgi:putative ABC transport system permease protein